MARVRPARLDGRGEGAHGEPAGRRRTQLPRPRRARIRRLHVRGRRPLLGRGHCDRRELEPVQALVLAGGEGTRLRPLTLTTPKPVLPLAGRPFLTFMLDWLHGHDVDEAILSLGFLSDAVHEVLGDIQSGMRLRYVHEEEPLGTAGPVRLAADEGILADRFLVLNGDVLTDMDLTEEVAEHEKTGATGTLALVEVHDVSSYGVVPTNDDGSVIEFREK